MFLKDSQLSYEQKKEVICRKSHLKCFNKDFFCFLLSLAGNKFAAQNVIDVSTVVALLCALEILKEARGLSTHPVVVSVK